LNSQFNRPRRQYWEKRTETGAPRTGLSLIKSKRFTSIITSSIQHPGALQSSGHRKLHSISARSALCWK